MQLLAITISNNASLLNTGSVYSLFFILYSFLHIRIEAFELPYDFQRLSLLDASLAEDWRFPVELYTL